MPRYHHRPYTYKQLIGTEVQYNQSRETQTLTILSWIYSKRYRAATLLVSGATLSRCSYPLLCAHVHPLHRLTPQGHKR